ncbi:MAG: hypothetical protein JWO76_3593 [Nocardioides sp.]|nr:hypothetical protein [Nocardioides sp.]
MDDIQTLIAILEGAGLSPDRVYLSPPPTADAPAPPEGRWVIVPAGAEYAVGGVGRGRFATYALATTIEDAGALVVRLLQTPAASIPAPAGVEAAGAATAQRIKERTAARGATAGPAAVGAGDALDLTGAETGHHLFALGTPMPERSAPPSEWGDYHRYLVQGPLPGAMEGVAAPWFEQPGGGPMVVLERPARWYVDRGYLVELV